MTVEEINLKNNIVRSTENLSVNIYIFLLLFIYFALNTCIFYNLINRNSQV